MREVDLALRNLKVRAFGILIVDSTWVLSAGFRGLTLLFLRFHYDVFVVTVDLLVLVRGQVESVVEALFEQSFLILRLLQPRDHVHLLLLELTEDELVLVMGLEVGVAVPRDRGWKMYWYFGSMTF
jgi:hypothetical protein